ncbi:hypothetical protein L6252_00260 [Candidatus Parcubacteria bacterium]|nr:hypothetical protein [Candidatus Parcubacteria bacterium]
MIKPIVNKKKTTALPPEKCFWVCDGQVLKNLQELKVALERMTENVFRHHVNGLKNDFAKWMSEVLGEKFLAGQLKRLKTAEGMAKKIKSKI